MTPDRLTARLALTLLASVSFVGATPHTLLIDLGHDTQTTAGNWNNFEAGQGGNPASLTELIDTDGTTTTINLAYTETFSTAAGIAGTGANYDGPYPTALAGIPQSALQDGMFVQQNGKATLTFSGLDPSLVYNWTFYGARGNNGGGATYELTGANSGTAMISNVLNNSEESATLAGISPTAGGVITLEVTQSNPPDQASLNFLQIDAVPDTVGPTIVSLFPEDGGAALSSSALIATFSEPVTPPVLLQENFESGDGGFTVAPTEGSDWEHGTPDSLSFGATVDSGNGAASGEGACWGTNLGAYAGGSGDPGYYQSGTTSGTITRLRSTPVDLTSVTGATLSFAHAFDLAPGDLAVVNLIDDTTDMLIASAIHTVPEGSSGWTDVPSINLSAGVGQVVRVEWLLDGSGGASDDYLGWYIDDVVVTGSNAGGITLKNLTEGIETVYLIDDPSVSIAGNMLTLSPPTPLEVGDSYAVRISGDILTDAAGNSFVGILDDDTWNFDVLGTILASSDTRADTSLTDPLDNMSTSDLAVGLVSGGRSFRTYLTFDLSSASAATGDTTLTLSPSGSENNTSAVAQTYTLFVLDSDWNGVAQPGPEGTAVASVDFTPQSGGNDDRGISFSSAALTTAFNNALGGNLHLGIKTNLEGADARSFLWLASVEDAGLEPRLIYNLDNGGSTFADWISGKSGVGGQTGLSDDPDRDGNDNGVENFFGTEPGEFSEGLVVTAVDAGAGTFTFTHPQGTLATDLTAGYQWSTDLSTFHDDGASSGGTTVSFTTVPDPVVAGTPTTVIATVTGTGVEKLFVRVGVTAN